MKKRYSRREFLIMAGAAGGSAILAGCVTVPAQAPPAEAPAAEESAADAPAPATEPVNISFSGWGEIAEDEGVRAAMAVFEEENPDIKMEWIHIPDAGGYNDKILPMVAAGTPPDTGFILSNSFATFVRDGLLLDITEQIKSDPVIGAEDWFIEPQETERSTVDGKWYGIGSCWVGPHIYYNADVFEEVGIEPPSNDPAEAWDWSHFLEVANQLTTDANGNHPGESGFDINNVQRWAIVWPTWWIPVDSAVVSNGGVWVNPDTGLIELDQPEAVEAIQAIADLQLTHQVNPSSTALETMSTTAQMLESGLVAMIVDGSWALSWLHEINATLGTAVLPKMKQPATTIQAHLHSVFADTEHPEEASRWVNFLATEFYQLQFLKIGLWLPSQTALTTPEGMEKWYTDRVSPTEGVHPEGYDLIVTDYVPNFGAVPSLVPGWDKANSILTPAMDAVWVGDMTAEEAMASAVPEANAILEAEM